MVATTFNNKTDWSFFFFYLFFFPSLKKQTFLSTPFGDCWFPFFFYLFHPRLLSTGDSRRPPPLNPYYTTIPSMHTLPLGMPSLPNISNMQIPSYAMQQTTNNWGTLHWAWERWAPIYKWRSLDTHTLDSGRIKKKREMSSCLRFSAKTSLSSIITLIILILPNPRP